MTDKCVHDIIYDTHGYLPPQHVIVNNLLSPGMAINVIKTNRLLGEPCYKLLGFVLAATSLLLIQRARKSP